LSKGYKIPHTGKPQGGKENTMTNKEYKARRDEHENANELYTYEKYNGWYVTRYMDTNDLRTLRNEYKSDKKIGAFTLDGFNGRAVIIPIENGFVLKSYETEVAAIVGGSFFKLWNGYSVTTMKHINAFRYYFGFPGMNKREWVEMDTPETVVSGNELHLVDMATGEIVRTAAR
jgi:hypothetical protein